MGFYKLEQRLVNWGMWLLYENDIGPDKARCTSLESSYIPEADDIWEPEPIHVVPNATDAELIDKLLALMYSQGKLGVNDRYCLAVRYGGYPAVIRLRRIGDHAMKKLADNAELMLFEELKKSA